jgi:hypothetical protein
LSERSSHEGTRGKINLKALAKAQYQAAEETSDNWEKPNPPIWRAIVIDSGPHQREKEASSFGRRYQPPFASLKVEGIVTLDQ